MTCPVCCGWILNWSDSVIIVWPCQVIRKGPCACAFAFIANSHGPQGITSMSSVEAVLLDRPTGLPRQYSYLQLPETHAHSWPLGTWVGNRASTDSVSLCKHPLYMCLQFQVIMASCPLHSLCLAIGLHDAYNDFFFIYAYISIVLFCLQFRSKWVPKQESTDLDVLDDQF